MVFYKIHVAIQKQLYDISGEIVRALNTKYVKMVDMLVPLSMAILTDYDEEYLGLTDPKSGEEKRGGGDDAGK